jgi:hypothetical protein
MLSPVSATKILSDICFHYTFQRCLGVEECVMPRIGIHDSNGRHQQAIAPSGFGRQESSSPIQLDVSIGMPVPGGPSDLIVLSVIHIWTIGYCNRQYHQARDYLDIILFAISL